MADTVQVLMEKMIPELEDLQEKNLFSADEIHQIIEQRREFEYMMKRVPLRKIDGLRYIEYELNLEALRKKRKDRLQLKKTSLSDISGIRRVHSIFDRILYKHRGSIDLWLQYIEFCKVERSGRVLSHVFTRALQSHPRSPELWIEAASYEFSVNLSIDSARVLMQRAIRINKHERKLWLEYFRLELLYIQKLTVRREILKLDGDTTAAPINDNDDGSTVLLEELPEEQETVQGIDKEMDALAQETAEKQKTRTLVLEGAIPRLIFTSAIEAIPDDVRFQLAFVEMADLFPQQFAVNLARWIVDNCRLAYPTSELVHTVHALRPLVHQRDDANVKEAENQVLSRFASSVEELRTNEMKEQFVTWLVDRLASPYKSATLVEYSFNTLNRYVVNNNDGVVSDVVCIKYVDLVHRTQGAKAALAVMQECVHTYNPHSACLWIVYSQLVLHTNNQNTEQNDEPRKTKRRKTVSTTAVVDKQVSPIARSIEVLQEALTYVNSDDYTGLYSVWKRLLELQIRDVSTSTSIIDISFQTAMKAQPFESEQWQMFREQYVVWTATVRPMTAVRALYKRFMEHGQLLPTDATYSFLLRCVVAETSVLSTEVCVDHVRNLFEKLIDLFGNKTEDVWIAYIEFYKQQSQFVDANRILNRAQRVWKESLRSTQLSM